MQNKIDDFILSMQNGNLAVFDDFYSSTYRLFYVVSYNVLRQKELVEEALQEAYVAIYKNIDKIDTKYNSLSYMYTIVKNKSLNILKKQVETMDIDDETMEYCIGDGNLKPHKDNDILNDCKKILNDKEYEIFTLSLVKGYKRREIAEMLNSNINTITWHYQQAIKKLKAKLKEDSYANK